MKLRKRYFCPQRKRVETELKFVSWETCMHEIFVTSPFSLFQPNFKVGNRFPGCQLDSSNPPRFFTLLVFRMAKCRFIWKTDFFSFLILNPGSKGQSQFSLPWQCQVYLLCGWCTGRGPDPNVWQVQIFCFWLSKKTFFSIFLLLCIVTKN